MALAMSGDTSCAGAVAACPEDSSEASQVPADRF